MPALDFLCETVMKSKPVLRVLGDILLTPALGALVLPMSFLMLVHWSLSADHPSSRGKAYEVWTTANGSFSVRVTAYHQVGGNPFLPGAYIGYEAAPLGTSNWRELVQFRVNDTIRIPRDSVRLVSDRVGYVLTPSKYVATLDGGHSWFDWEPGTAGPAAERLRWVIRGAQVDVGGAGVIHLYRYDPNLKEELRLDLHTSDFGRSWSEVN